MNTFLEDARADLAKYRGQLERDKQSVWDIVRALEHRVNSLELVILLLNRTEPGPPPEE